MANRSREFEVPALSLDGSLHLEALEGGNDIAAPL